MEGGTPPLRLRRAVGKVCADTVLKFCGGRDPTAKEARGHTVMSRAETMERGSSPPFFSWALSVFFLRVLAKIKGGVMGEVEES